VISQSCFLAQQRTSYKITAAALASAAAEVWAPRPFLFLLCRIRHENAVTFPEKCKITHKWEETRKKNAELILF